MLWEGISTYPLICLHRFVSTGCLRMQFSKWDPSLFDFLVGCRLISRRNALAFQFVCYVFLDQTIYFLPTAKTSAENWSICERSTYREKKLASLKFSCFSSSNSQINYELYLYVFLEMSFSWTIVLAGGCQINEKKMITTI